MRHYVTRYPRSEAERVGSPFAMLGSTAPGPQIPPVHRPKSLTLQTDPRFRLGRYGGSNRINRRNIVALDQTILQFTADPTVASWSLRIRPERWRGWCFHPCVKKFRLTREPYFPLPRFDPPAWGNGGSDSARGVSLLCKNEVRPVFMPHTLNLISCDVFVDQGEEFLSQ